MRKTYIYCFVPLFVFFLSGAAGADDGLQPAVFKQQAPVDRVSLDIKGMDIVDVLKMLAARSDMNLVIDKNVAGRVTVFLKDVHPKDALDVVLASNNLVAKTDSGITRIMTGQDYEQAFGVKFYDAKELRRIPLKYAKPQDLISVLNQVKSSIGVILADDTTNSIILYDTKEKNGVGKDGRGYGRAA